MFAIVDSEMLEIFFSFDEMIKGGRVSWGKDWKIWENCGNNGKCGNDRKEKGTWKNVGKD